MQRNHLLNAYLVSSQVFPVLSLTGYSLPKDGVSELYLGLIQYITVRKDCSMNEPFGSVSMMVRYLRVQTSEGEILKPLRYS